MFIAKLCYVILLLIHHGGAEVIQFNVSEDSPAQYKAIHGKILPIVNKAYDRCKHETKMTDTEVSDAVRNIVSENNMTISESFGCFMYCFTRKTELLNEAHQLHMKLSSLVTEVYTATLRPYPRLRAIISVMLACYMKMKSLTRQSHCDLFRNLFKCVALYEQEYGPYTVRPK